jgi:hypothetical protein
VNKPATIGLRSYGVKGDTMKHVNLSGCNASTHAQQCDCRNCISKQLDLMELLRMEFH